MAAVVLLVCGRHWFTVTLTASGNDGDGRLHKYVLFSNESTKPIMASLLPA